MSNLLLNVRVTIVTSVGQQTTRVTVKSVWQISHVREWTAGAIGNYLSICVATQNRVWLLPNTPKNKLKNNELSQIDAGAFICIEL